MLRVWNAVLVSLAFCLSLFGTFLTRSGVISSIHSFTQSSIGPWLLGFIAVVAAFSTALIFWRLPLLRTKTRLESLASREAAFLYNNLLLVALTLTVLWGVAFPLLSEARARREDHRRRAVLRLLPARARAAAAAADGHRAARRLAAHLATRARREPGRAGGVRARVRDRAGRARRRLEQARRWSRTRSARSCSRRSRSSSSAARGRARRSTARAGRRRSRRSSAATAGATAATSSMRRSSCSRSASPAARTARRRCRSSSRARRCRSAATTCATSARSCATSPNRHRDPRPARGLARRSEPRHLPRRQEQLPGRAAGLQRGRHPHRLAARAGPVPDRRPVQQRRLGRAQGARQPARRPDLAGRLRLPARLADRDVAGRARAAPAGAARRARSRPRDPAAARRPHVHHGRRDGDGVDLPEGLELPDFAELRHCWTTTPAPRRCARTSVLPGDRRASTASGPARHADLAGEPGLGRAPRLLAGRARRR